MNDRTLNLEKVKFPQVHAAFHYLYDMTQRTSYNGSLYEFGVYQGDSLKLMCEYIRDNQNFWWTKNPHVFGFDSFEGLIKEAEGVELFPQYVEGAYKLQSDDPIKYIKDKVNYQNLDIIKGRFDQLTKNSCSKEMKPAILIHIDCDLYLSTYQALNWCAENKLITKNTLVAFDEYISTKSNSGEKLAFEQIVERYGLEAEEIFHYYYPNKHYPIKIKQSLFEITKV
jgi:hypothetical protein